MTINRGYFEKGIYAMIFAGMLTTVFSPTLNLVLFFSDICWFYILIQYGNTKNREFFLHSLIVFLSFGFGFTAVKLITGHSIRFLSSIETILLGITLIEIIIAIVFSLSMNCRKENIPDLYNERFYDKERINSFISNVSILGINADWGMGKTFLMEHLKQDKEIDNIYDIIQIDLLSCNLDSIDLILVEEIEKVFSNHRIYPENSHGLKRVLGKDKWIDLFGNLIFGETKGMAATFEGYKKELKKLPKKILVIFEDIDRINDPQTIRKIFAISEKLADQQFHIIYQYDYRKLEELGFTREYIEKYIPYTMNLTEISYEKIVEYQWNELHMEETGLEIEKVSRIGQYMQGQYEMNQILGMDVNLSIDLDGVSIRKVHVFLTELKMMILENPELQKKEVIEIVINGVFVKHFFMITLLLFVLAIVQWKVYF